MESYISLTKFTINGIFCQLTNVNFVNQAFISQQFFLCSVSFPLFMFLKNETKFWCSLVVFLNRTFINETLRQFLTISFRFRQYAHSYPAPPLSENPPFWCTTLLHSYENHDAISIFHQNHRPWITLFFNYDTQLYVILSHYEHQMYFQKFMSYESILFKVIKKYFFNMLYNFKSRQNNP